MSSKKYSEDIKYLALSKNLNKIKQSKRFGNYRKMAGLLGIHHQHLSDIVRLRKEPSPMLIELMAKTFNVPRDRLLSDEGFVAEHSEEKSEQVAEAMRTFDELIRSGDKEIIDHLDRQITLLYDLHLRRKKAK